MQYVVCCAEAADAALSVEGVRLLAQGDAVVFEGPWPFARTALLYAHEDRALTSLKAKLAGTGPAYAVAGLSEPGQGTAFAIAAHKMLDPVGFKPYVDAIHDLLTRFGVRSLARAGTVTPLEGAFVPERAVVLQFTDLDAAVAFYTSQPYAPLLGIRLRTTEPRFVVLTETLHDDVRSRAERAAQASQTEARAG